MKRGSSCNPQNIYNSHLVLDRLIRNCFYLHKCKTHIDILRMCVQKLLWFVLTSTCLFSFVAHGQFIYLNNGAFKFIAGIGLPVNVGLSGGSVTWFTNVQVFYKLPDNITYYEPYKIMEKRSVKNTFNRYNIYQALVKYFDRLGVVGDQCIHRFICEIHRRKINSRSNSLLAEVIQILFSPASHFQPGLEEHRNAQWQGTYNTTDCSVLFKHCSVKENSIFSS